MSYFIRTLGYPQEYDLDTSKYFLVYQLLPHLHLHCHIQKQHKRTKLFALTVSEHFSSSLLTRETVTCILTPGLWLPDLSVFPVTSGYIRPRYTMDVSNLTQSVQKGVSSSSSALRRRESSSPGHPTSGWLPQNLVATTLHSPSYPGHSNRRRQKLRAERLQKATDLNSHSISIQSYFREAGAHQASAIT